ncbi:transcriptional regulator [Methylobacterium oxalidis]|uniref:transcriptional regulator n=1 Tax=Methylobacterium oxalidis TaxID=944322 RepID=UPI0033149BAD
MKLPELTALLWRAFGAGQVTEAEAEELSSLIELRNVPQAPLGSPRKAVGSRPRSNASMERRRRWAASGRLPPALAASFTLAEAAVLAVVAAETARRGDCRLTVGHIAAVAGVSETTVRNALREARKLALVTVEERRLSAWRNDSNVVRTVSPEWLAWLRLGPKGEGANSRTPRLQKVLNLPRQGHGTLRKATDKRRAEPSRSNDSPLRSAGTRIEKSPRLMR